MLLNVLDQNDPCLKFLHRLRLFDERRLGELRSQSRQGHVFQHCIVRDEHIAPWLALLKVKMCQLLARGLGSSFADDSWGPIRSQELWDSPHRWLGSALVEIPWDDIAPRPT